MMTGCCNMSDTEQAITTTTTITPLGCSQTCLMMGTQFYNA